MRKIILIAAGLLFLYQVFAVVLLYTSDYLTVSSYYTHPPLAGGVELRRLPMLFGDSIALKILEERRAEAEELVQSGQIGMAAVLSSYEHNTALPEVEAKLRAIEMAKQFILAGYDISSCESDGRSTATVLRDWGVLDADIKSFIVGFYEGDDVFDCV